MSVKSYQCPHARQESQCLLDYWRGGATGTNVRSVGSTPLSLSGRSQSATLLHHIFFPSDYLRISTSFHAAPLETPSLLNDRSPTILACSSALNRRMDAEHMALIGSGRKLCEDRKGVFDHLHPRPLFKSTVRIVILQGTQVATQYLNDQLKEDLARDELVDKGKLTRREADEESDEWAKREWKRRWVEFPHRIFVALGKYHSIILVMRFYEHLASRWFDKVTLDKLTMDTFDSAKRSSKVWGKTGTDLMADVFQTCWRANLLSYLADFSVHEVILLFGYYVYLRDQRRLRRKHQQVSSDGDEEDDRAVSGAILVYSVVRSSTLLAISRAVGLLFSSIGGSLGSLVAPAWGSLAGANLGDGLAMALSEEIIGAQSPPLT